MSERSELIPCRYYKYTSLLLTQLNVYCVPCSTFMYHLFITFILLCVQWNELNDRKK